MSIGSLKSNSSIIWRVDCDKSLGLIASASGDSLVNIWNPLMNNQSSDVSHCSPKSLSGSSSDVYAVKFISGQYFSSNYLLSGGYDKIVRLWDTKSGTCVREFFGHLSSVTALGVSPSGNIVFSGGRDNQFKSWDLMSGGRLSTVDRNLSEVTGMDVSSDGMSAIVACKDNCHHLVDIRSNKVESNFRGLQNIRINFLQVRFLEQYYIYSGSEEGNVYFWDTRTQQIIRKLSPPFCVSSVFDVVYNKHDHSLYTGSEDGMLCRWDCVNDWF